MRVIAVNTDSKKNIILDVDPDDKVIKVKQQIQQIEGLSLDQQRLSLDKQLDDGLRIKDYEIKEGSIIQLKTIKNINCRSLRSNITVNERGNFKWIGQFSDLCEFI